VISSRLSLFNSKLIDNVSHSHAMNKIPHVSEKKKKKRKANLLGNNHLCNVSILTGERIIILPPSMCIKKNIYEARVSGYNLRQSASSYINDQRYKENQESAIEIPALQLSLCQIYRF
jgi:uncharacterized ubiquitin-like protein YukD